LFTSDPWRKEGELWSKQVIIVEKETGPKKGWDGEGMVPKRWYIKVGLQGGVRDAPIF